MVLRPESVRRRLLKLEEVISRLETVGPMTAEELRNDFRDAWVVERGLQLAAEIFFDIGNHILSAHFGTSASDYEAILAGLGAHQVVAQELADRLRGLGGFRNILVHDYLELDLDRVADAFTRAPRDFTEFSLAVRQWLDRLE